MNICTVFKMIPNPGVVKKFYTGSGFSDVKKGDGGSRCSQTCEYRTVLAIVNMLCFTFHIKSKKMVTLFQVKKSRDIRPNDGFIRQLADLEQKINKTFK